MNLRYRQNREMLVALVLDEVEADPHVKIKCYNKTKRAWYEINDDKELVKLVRRVVDGLEDKRVF